LAVANHPNFEVSAVDVDRGGATYTIDTLTALREQHPTADLYFILGTDAWFGIKTWRNWELLGDLATFVVVARPGFELSETEAPEGLTALLVNIDAVDLSSTECRHRAVAGESLAGLVPEPVITYILDKNLYQEAE
jgi:nicotinate-nucleotide adenylyltransferase